MTPRTRLALVSHVTSPTALVLPVARDRPRARPARRRHARRRRARAGHGARSTSTALGAAYWTGNGHKWLCAPKGSGVLHVRADRPCARSGRWSIVARRERPAHGPVPVPARVRLDGHGRSRRLPRDAGRDPVRGRAARGRLVRADGREPRPGASRRGTGCAPRSRCRAPAPDAMLGSMAADPPADGRARRRPRRAAPGGAVRRGPDRGPGARRSRCPPRARRARARPRLSSGSVPSATTGPRSTRALGERLAARVHGARSPRSLLGRLRGLTESARQPRPSSGIRAPVTAAAAGDASQAIASASSSGVVQPAVFAFGWAARDALVVERPDHEDVRGHAVRRALARDRAQEHLLGRLRDRVAGAARARGPRRTATTPPPRARSRARPCPAPRPGATWSVVHRCWSSIRRTSSWSRSDDRRAAGPAADEVERATSSRPNAARRRPPPRARPPGSRRSPARGQPARGRECRAPRPARRAGRRSEPSRATPRPVRGEPSGDGAARPARWRRSPARPASSRRHAWRPPAARAGAGPAAVARVDDEDPGRARRRCSRRRGGPSGPRRGSRPGPAPRTCSPWVIRQRPLTDHVVLVALVGVDAGAEPPGGTSRLEDADVARRAGVDLA